MSDTNQKQKNIHTRPIDPSENYSDMIGDTSGLTGMTTGSAAQSSAEPSDITDVDSAHLPGGIISDPQHTNPVGIPKTAISDKAYNRSVQQTISSTVSQAADDIGNDSSSGDLSTNPGDIDTPASNQANPNSDIPSPSIIGEQSVSGDMPDPESDDDTLANAQAVGTQISEDTEHPQELHISRDIDTAEEHIRTH